MADMNTLQTKIENLINQANSTTGNNDTTLTAAFNSLKDGYGKGESTLGLYLNKELTQLTEKDFGGIGDYSNDVNIPNGFFKEQTLLENIELADFPSSKIFLGDETFFGCNNLKKVTLPDGINIPRRCFWGCDLSEGVSTKRYNNFAQIGEEAFAYTNVSMSNIKLQGSISSIYPRAFLNSPGPGTVAINYETSFIVIGDYAFSNCTNIYALALNQDYYDEYFYPSDNGMYNERIEIGEGAFMNSSIEHITFGGPSFECLQRVRIHKTAFQGTSIEKILCSDGYVPISEVLYG